MSYSLLDLGVEIFLGVSQTYPHITNSTDKHPGPPTVPLLGNLHQMPLKNAHLKYVPLSFRNHSLTFPRFTEWARTYGGMYSLKLGPGTMIVLTDKRLIKQLIDKKSSIYSNRPPSYVGNGLITGGDHLLVMDYGPVWRAFRKTIHQHFMERVVVNEHTKLVNAEAVQMCRDFLLQPGMHMSHPKRFSNSIVMSLREYSASYPETSADTTQSSECELP